MDSTEDVQALLEASEKFMQKTVVVGAGPVGALAALYAARRGDLVEVYELRSERGINSLRLANCPGLLRSIINDTIPMRGRMIHGEENGRLTEKSQQYDVLGRAIRATDRNGLNKRLLDELQQMPNVRLKFNHKLTGADFKRNLAWFERKSPTDNGSKERPEEIEVKFDFMIGADGAHSAARFHMMKFARVSFQQEYIDTLWCEFHIEPADETHPTTRTDGFRISPNHLHIWPGSTALFIAIPSTDKSFTCTLFMSESEFEKMDADRDKLVPFFEENFPGVSPQLISPDELKAQFRRNPHLPLISVKCHPYHFGSSVVIVGDAAHAMVPFYGQGMNAGMEDVRVLYDIMDKHCPPLHKSRVSFTAEGRIMGRASALQEYSYIRQKDAHTINDLAMGNYQEMKAHVTSRVYILRKKVEEFLSVWVPILGFRTQYSRVSFSNERYSEVVNNVRWQQSFLDGVGLIFLAAATGMAASYARSRRLR